LLAVLACPVFFAHRASEMLATLRKYSPRFGNARRALEMLAALQKCSPRFAVLEPDEQGYIDNPWA